MLKIFHRNHTRHHAQKNDPRKLRPRPSGVICDRGLRHKCRRGADDFPVCAGDAAQEGTRNSADLTHARDDRRCVLGLKQLRLIGLLEAVDTLRVGSLEGVGAPTLDERDKLAGIEDDLAEPVAEEATAADKLTESADSVERTN